MRLPSYITVGGQYITLTQTDGPLLMHEHEGDDHAEAYGMYDSTAQAIFLGVQSDERMRETLVHESLHAMLRSAKVDEPKTEEDLVDRIAPLLLGWLRTNPNLIDFLTFIPYNGGRGDLSDPLGAGVAK